MLSDALKQVPTYTNGGLVWIQHHGYLSAGCQIWHQCQDSQGESIAQLERSFQYYGCRLLALEINSQRPPVFRKPLYSDLPTDMQGPDAHYRV